LTKQEIKFVLQQVPANKGGRITWFSKVIKSNTTGYTGVASMEDVNQAAYQ